MTSEKYSELLFAIQLSLLVKKKSLPKISCPRRSAKDNCCITKNFVNGKQNCVDTNGCSSHIFHLST